MRGVSRFIKLTQTFHNACGPFYGTRTEELLTELASSISLTTVKNSLRGL